MYNCMKYESHFYVHRIRLYLFKYILNKSENAALQLSIFCEKVVLFSEQETPLTKHAVLCFQISIYEHISLKRQRQCCRFTVN